MNFLSNIESSVLLITAIFLPLAAAAVINVLSKTPKARDFTGMVFAAIQTLFVFTIASRYLAGETIKAEFFEMLPGITINFHVEGIGIIYAAVASFLWLITLIYSFSYLRANNIKNQTRFYIFFAIAIACSMGMAFSGNMLTMLIFYEAMTLSTYPLVIHKGGEKDKAAGRTYLRYLIGTSIVLFLPAIIWIFHTTGSIEFIKGGVFADTQVSNTVICVMLLMVAFGIGKAALMPLHKWLPAAMVAPTPVSALLHAVAVVKAGVFCITKIIFYIFGTAKLSQIADAEILSYIAAITIVIASVVAIFQDNLKSRLAYSTIAQLAYITLAASIFSLAAVIAASAQIIAHAVAKITLFFAAGSFATVAGKKKVSELDGLAQKMPLSSLAFLIASLSMIGLPMLAGGESKNLIEMAAIEADKMWIIYVLYLSMALNAIYYLPISYRLFFKKCDVRKKLRTPFSIKLALTITTILTITYYAYIDIAIDILEML